MSLTEREISEDILESCQQGDMAAFETLFQAYNDKIFTIALRFCNDVTTAQDITQNVFIKIYLTINQFHFESQFDTWLYRIVVNTCIDELKKNKHRLLLDQLDTNQLMVNQSQEDRYIKREVREAIQSVIMSLSPKLRLPLILKYIEGLSYIEIAEILGCSMGTVASRLNTGHKIIASKLAYLREYLDL